MVTFDDLSEPEQQYYQDDQTELSLHDYGRNWERREAFGDELDPEALDRDSD